MFSVTVIRKRKYLALLLGDWMYAILIYMVKNTKYIRAKKFDLIVSYIFMSYMYLAMLLFASASWNKIK